MYECWNVSRKLKIAKVIPIYKKGNEKLLNNYRSISLLPVISKVFEKVIYDQLHTHLSSYNIISNCQYGFRRHHSTELTAIKLIDRTSEPDHGQLYLIYIYIYIDLIYIYIYIYILTCLKCLTGLILLSYSANLRTIAYIIQH